EQLGEAVQDQLPHIRAAKQLRLESPARGVELEARILARQTHAQIATHLGLEEAVVKAYADCYFDVGDRLTATAYILLAAIFSRCSMKDSAIPQEAFLRALGYYGGPLVLESALPYYSQFATWLEEPSGLTPPLPIPNEERLR